MKGIKLSIVIVSFNTKDLLLACIESVIKNTAGIDYEIIVVDNGSTDGTVEQIQNAKVKIIKNKTNLGFARGNNRAKILTGGKYVLFLNSDTIVGEGTLQRTVAFMDENPQVGAVTCKTVLPNGNLDPDARRAFPTPWVAFTHFLGLDRVFPKSRLFAKYWYGYKSADKIQEIDVLQGAFFLTRRWVLDEVGWFDEDYFLDGEDIDLCWKIKERGYKIVYYPDASIVHIKKASKKKVKSLQSAIGGVRAMEIFYKKRLARKYNFIVNFLVLLGIGLLKFVRFVKFKLGI